MSLRNNFYTSIIDVRLHPKEMKTLDKLVTKLGDAKTLKRFSLLKFKGKLIASFDNDSRTFNNTDELINYMETL